MTDEEYCKGCVYWRSLYGNGRQSTHVCHYLLDTFKVRGCKFGNGCDKWSDEKEGSKVWLDSPSGLSSGERSDT